jgi:hypothetical protein
MRNKNENIAQQLVPPLIPMSFLAFFSIFPLSDVGPIPTPPSLVPLISHQKGRVSRAAGRWPPRIDGWRGTTSTAGAALSKSPLPAPNPTPTVPTRTRGRESTGRQAGQGRQAGRAGQAGRTGEGRARQGRQAGRQASSQAPPELKSKPWFCVFCVLGLYS